MPLSESSSRRASVAQAPAPDCLPPNAIRKTSLAVPETRYNRRLSTSSQTNTLYARRKSLAMPRFMHPSTETPHIMPKYLNSFKTEPDDSKRFRTKAVADIIDDILKDRLAGLAYCPERCRRMISPMTEEIKAEVKLLGFDRYKLVCVLHIGSLKNQDVRIANDREILNIPEWQKMCPDFVLKSGSFGWRRQVDALECVSRPRSRSSRQVLQRFSGGAISEPTPKSTDGFSSMIDFKSTRLDRKGVWELIGFKFVLKVFQVSNAVWCVEVFWFCRIRLAIVFLVSMPDGSNEFSVTERFLVAVFEAIFPSHKTKSGQNSNVANQSSAVSRIAKSRERSHFRALTWKCFEQKALIPKGFELG
ncbi:hypothetical protein QZH41_004809 [Actinostola sp. cb2023]|nr:hypothetical protein QZH41_004809 [Actinostola sp. cb2023]